MAYTVRVHVDGRQFEQFLRRAPKEARAILSPEVKKTAFIVGQRMKAKAPVGPDAPHIKDDISVKGSDRGSLTARVGFFDQTPSAPGSETSNIDVALYNEYKPNAQPFMRPAAYDEGADFGTRLTRALKGLEGRLSVSGSGL